VPLKVTEGLPREHELVENTWIPLSDGTRLAAKLWLPKGAEQAPVPAILEYIPYRKRDFTAPRDQLVHPYFAGHGYASVRVDLRGSGDSEGVLRDEYLQQELEDGVEVLRWIAAQPWCSGDVGMIGISWGGFNGLQIAALQPPELKAVITICSTDDRYADDIHYMGGCLLGDNLSWASSMFVATACPPDPRVVGEDRWRDLWHERLEGSGMWLEPWLTHQRRDAYWAHASICEDFSAVKCPVLAVSGWADGYSNSVFRLLAHLDVPRQGLVGPWGHRYPHLGLPGPAIDFLHEAVRWWDRWLKDEENGVEDEPMLRAWMQDSVPPSKDVLTRPGRWVAEPCWPSPSVIERRYALTGWGIRPEGGSTAVEEAPLTVQSPLSVGLFAGKWCSFSATPDLPHDQREEDGGALVFDSPPLEEPLEILGAPVVELTLTSNEPVAQIAVRLSDIAPDHKATRVTYGLLNLCHRESHADPKPLEPGRAETIRIALCEVAQSFPAGHRLRIAVSTSYWPVAWPPPRPVTLEIESGALVLPTRTPRGDDAELRPFGPAQAPPPYPKTVVEPRSYKWLVTRDLERDVSTLEVVKDEGVVRFEPIELQVERRTVERYSYKRDQFDSVRGETENDYVFERGADWRVRIRTRIVLTSNATDFRIRAELDAWEGSTRVAAKNWDVRIPRDHL